MNFFQVQEFFKQMHPCKTIIFTFDEKCHCMHEINYTDGIPNAIHHIENNKVKVSIEGMDPTYVSIQPHRQNISWEDIKKMIMAK